MTDCFRCGDSDHLSYDCPSRTPMRAAPEPAIGLAPSPSNRPEDKPIPEPVSASDRAAYDDVAPWAEWVRERMGWPRTGTEAREAQLRVKASEQVRESQIIRRTIIG